MPVTLTARDQDLLDVLAWRVRVLSAEQVARTWWPESTRPLALAADRIARLATAGLLTSERFLAQPELMLERPIVSWTPGNDAPAFGAIANALSRRWSGAPRLTPCVYATGETRERHGAPRGRFPRRVEVTHDLHLGQVFLRMRALDPARAATWQSEEEVNQRALEPGEKLPDATVGEGRKRTAIELAGLYGAKKLRDFHAYCFLRDLPYELW